MKIIGIKAVFYSATGNTKKVVMKTAEHAAELLHVPVEQYEFTLSSKRESVLEYSKDWLVIVGLPVYAGRIPNKIAPFVQSYLKGNGAWAVPVVTFGNRSYDNALIELRNELERNGFHTIAGAAFVSEHAFSDQLAFGRPDQEDLCAIEQFAKDIVAKLSNLEEIPPRISVKGMEPIDVYYTPLGMDGKPAVFLKAKPKTRENCTYCKRCAEVCPMGSIENKDPTIVSGICIKCQACVKVCPEHAKYFDDPAFLSHIEMLEHHYVRRAENEVFVL